MAVISAIRKRTGLVLGLVAVAVAGFIVMDMTSGGGQGAQGSDMTIVKVAGEKVDWKEMLRTEEILYSGSDADVFSRRDYLFNYFVEKAIIEKEAGKLGLGVSVAELAELQFGTEKSPLIQQRFMDPNTGAINQQQLNQIRQDIQNGTLQPELRAFWSIQEKEIIKDRLQTKLNQLVTKGLYAPAFVANDNFRSNNDKYTIDYVKVGFDAIPDSEVEVTDKAINDYINANKNKYKQKEETRKVEYAVLEVIPTSKDTADILASLENLIESFKNAENDTLFVENNSGMFDAAYDKLEDLPEAIGTDIFNTPVGEVYGPYEENGTFRIAKVVDRKMIPDSVRSRHILIRANTMEEAIAAQTKLDSIKTVLKNGQATFEEMAARFSQDGSAQNGGDLNFAGPGMMVQPFNDFIFYNGEIGKPDMVFTQFGLHLVEVTDRKFISREQGVQLAIVTREIIPSEDTQGDVFERAFELVNNNRTLEKLREAIQASGDLRLTPSQPFQRNDFRVASLTPGSDAREIVRWAYGKNRKAGEVSGDVYSSSSPGSYFVEKYIIVGLSDIIGEGVPSAASMRKELEGLVRNQLKAKKIIDKIAGKGMEEIKSVFPSAVSETANDVSFSGATLGNAGVEPKVVGTALGLALNTPSKPIEGNGGVYVVKTTASNPATMSDPSMFKSTAQTNARRQYDAMFMDGLRNRYSITDNRFKFY